MRFSEKLSKLRKKHNLSQEQLAEKLNMSRQAVSKWESGSSYPDMATIIEICKILNCTINDIMDDDVIDKKTSTQKVSINDLINDFLSFITKSYNMFYSMSWSEKFKFIFEMGIIILCLMFLISFIGKILSALLFGLIGHSTSGIIIDYIFRFLNFTYLTVTFVLSIIIFIHLFKIRYLDYYITIEDKNVSKKKIEVPVDNKEQNLKKEKVIIRDPKHSSYNFFNSLTKFLSICFKVFLSMVLFLFLISFSLFVCLIIYSLFLLNTHALFLGIIIFSIGCLAINYAVLDFGYSLLFSLKKKIKLYFIILIVGLSLIGIGLAVTLFKGTNLEYNHLEPNLLEQKELVINMEDNLIISFINRNVDVIFEERNDLKFELFCSEFYECKLYNYTAGLYETDGLFNIYEYNTNLNPSLIYKKVIQGFKENKTYSIDINNNIKFKLYISEHNYNKLLENLKLY